MRGGLARAVGGQQVGAEGAPVGAGLGLGLRRRHVGLGWRQGGHGGGGGSRPSERMAVAVGAVNWKGGAWAAEQGRVGVQAWGVVQGRDGDGRSKGGGEGDDRHVAGWCGEDGEGDGGGGGGGEGRGVAGRRDGDAF